MDEQKPRLIGSDGELIGQIGHDGELIAPFPKEKRKRHPRDRKHLTKWLRLLMQLMVILFSGAVLGLRVVSVPSKLSNLEILAMTPEIYFNDAYDIIVNPDQDTNQQISLPCTSRSVSVNVEGEAPVRVRLVVVTNNISYASLGNVLTLTERTNTFDLPITKGIIFSLSLYDTQDKEVAGVTHLQIGNGYFANCLIKIAFRPKDHIVSD